MNLGRTLKTDFLITAVGKERGDKITTYHKGQIVDHDNDDVRLRLPVSGT